MGERLVECGDQFPLWLEGFGTPPNRLRRIAEIDCIDVVLVAWWWAFCIRELLDAFAKNLREVPNVHQESFKDPVAGGRCVGTLGDFERCTEHGRELPRHIFRCSPDLVDGRRERH